MTDKLCIGVIFGGRSVEHDVSVLTGLQVIQALEKDKYEIVPIYTIWNPPVQRTRPYHQTGVSTDCYRL
jgi:D-alanine-D-alanine ligase-like ATP-grasp enzyme